MILNHLWGLYSHPDAQWRAIHARHEHIVYSISHLALVALVPAICSYFSVVYLGWYDAHDQLVTLSSGSGLAMALTLYVALLTGVAALAGLIWRLAIHFDSWPSFTQSIELASYSATPLMMSGFCALYPEPSFALPCLVLGLSYAVYLLYCGVPILIQPKPEYLGKYRRLLALMATLLLSVLVGALAFLWGDF